jgi:hypothetical protein
MKNGVIILMVAVMMTAAMGAGCTSYSPAEGGTNKYYEDAVHGIEIAKMEIIGTVNGVNDRDAGRLLLCVDSSGYNVHLVDGRKIAFYNGNNECAHGEDRILIKNFTHGKGLTVYNTYRWTAKKYSTSPNWVLTDVVDVTP